MIWSPAGVQHGGVPSAVCGDGASAVSRDPLPALAVWRGPDGTDGDAAIRPGQVMIQSSKVHTLEKKVYMHTYIYTHDHVITHTLSSCFYYTIRASFLALLKDHVQYLGKPTVVFKLAKNVKSPL